MHNPEHLIPRNCAAWKTKFIQLLYYQQTAQFEVPQNAEPVQGESGDVGCVPQGLALPHCCCAGCGCNSSVLM